MPSLLTCDFVLVSSVREEEAELWACGELNDSSDKGSVRDCRKLLCDFWGDVDKSIHPRQCTSKKWLHSRLTLWTTEFIVLLSGAEVGVPSSNMGDSQAAAPLNSSPQHEWWLRSCIPGAPCAICRRLYLRIFGLSLAVVDTCITQGRSLCILSILWASWAL